MSNKEALEELKARKEHYEMDDDCEFLVEALEKGIKALENQKTGYWVLKRVSPTQLYGENIKEYECSECYRKIRCTESQLINYPYCHCGAKMEGE